MEPCSMDTFICPKKNSPIFSQKLTRFIQTLCNADNGHFSVPSHKLSYIVNPTLWTLVICTLSIFIVTITVPLKNKLPPFISFLLRRISFLSRITEAFLSMAYTCIMRQRPVMCNDCCSAINWQIDGTVHQKRHVSSKYYYLQYITDFLIQYKPPRALHSSEKKLLQVPHFKLKSYGGRSFSYIAPYLQNQLPDDIRQAPSLATFKSNLKTYLFDQAFLLNILVFLVSCFSHFYPIFPTHTYM